MNISNDSPAVDYVKYFTDQFPKDLAQMASLRDELAKRQGAMSAVQDAAAAPYSVIRFILNCIRMAGLTYISEILFY